MTVPLSAPAAPLSSAPAAPLSSDSAASHVPDQVTSFSEESAAITSTDPVAALPPDSAAPSPPEPVAAPPLATAAADVEIITPEGDHRGYRYFVLANYLQGVLISDPDTDKISVSLSTPAGYYSDPVGFDGLASLIQRSLLFGQTTGHSFRKFVLQNNGSVKGFTLSTRSYFAFDADGDVLVSALERFAKLFAEPPLSPEIVERPVDSDCCHDTRSTQNELHSYVTSRIHGGHKLSFDDWKLLQHRVNDSLDLKNEVKKFYDALYSSNLMRLVVYAKVSLDELEKIVSTCFSELESRNSSFPTHSYKDGLFQENLIKVASESGHHVSLCWPVARSSTNLTEIASCQYIIHLLNDDREGSIIYNLKCRGWIENLAAGEMESDSKSCLISITIDLTAEGQDNFEDVCAMVFKYIKMLKKAGPRMYLFEEMKVVSQVKFNTGTQTSPLKHVENISSNILMFPPIHWLVGLSAPSTYSLDTIRHVLKMLTLDKIRIFWTSEKFHGQCIVETVPIHELQQWGDSIPNGVLYLPKKAATLSGNNVNEKVSVAPRQHIPVSKKREQMTIAVKEPAPTPRMSQRNLGRQEKNHARITGQALSTCNSKEAEQKDVTVLAKALSTCNSKEAEQKDVTVLAKGRICIIFDEQMLLHIPDNDHPECPERINAIYKRLKKDGVLQSCSVYPSERTKLKDMLKVHGDQYALRILGAKSLRKEVADDMYYSDHSDDAIFLAAGGAIKACRMVATGDHEHAFAVVRPPGHHAKKNEESGFCYMNNIAIAAMYLRKKHKKEKILILDWDVHFGDGTEEIFRSDGNVLFISLHRLPFLFPDDDGGYGDVTNIGEGQGKGFTCNVCWRESGVKNDDLYAVMDYIVLPLARQFDPDMILISGGFDAARNDRLGDCSLTKVGYATALHKLLQLRKGLVMILEGYTLDVLGKCCSSCVKVLCGDFSEVEHNKDYEPLESTWKVVLELRAVLRRYWSSLASKIPEEILARTRIKHPIPKKVQSG